MRVLVVEDDGATRAILISTLRARRHEVIACADGSGLVLLVDDEEAVRGVARRVLERSGFGILEASTGDAALTLCEEHHGKLRIVLLDLTMPGLSGAVTLAEIRRRWPSLPVVVSSGLVPDEGDGLAGVPFLAKPYRPSELVDAVSRLLEGETPALQV